jgi:hypothetical protein
MSGLSLVDFTVARGEAVIVRGVNFEVERGRVTVLLGPNGSGKRSSWAGSSCGMPFSRDESLRFCAFLECRHQLFKRVLGSFDPKRIDLQFAFNDGDDQWSTGHGPRHDR